MSYARAHKADRILIEDAGVGTALVAELARVGLSAIAIKPEHDKRTRMSIESGKFESGQVIFPNQAPWLADLEAELFAFPKARHDDQVEIDQPGLDAPIGRIFVVRRSSSWP